MSDASVRSPAGIYKRPSRRNRRSADIRERLYHSALKLFAERGYFATTVEDITEAADLGKGTFFNYFPSKEHVLSTFGDQRLLSFERALEDIRDRGADVAAALGRTVASLTNLGPDSAGLFRNIFAAHACSDSVRSHFRERMGRCQHIIAAILAIGQERGDVRHDRGAAEMARVMQQTFMGLTMSWSMNPEEPLSRLSGVIWDALWEKFRAAGGKAMRGRGNRQSDSHRRRRMNYASRK